MYLHFTIIIIKLLFICLVAINLYPEEIQLCDHLYLNLGQIFGVILAEIFNTIIYFEIKQMGFSFNKYY